MGQDVAPMLEAAASSDQEVARMLATWKEQRAAMLADSIRGMARSLRPGITPEWAAASVRALSSPGIFEELVRGEGWPPDRYESWLVDLLVGLLLPT